MPSSHSSFSPTIIFLNLPPKTLLGINLTTLNSAPTFHGITNAPPGLIFIYTGTDAALSIRHGRWLNVTPSTLYILQWNSISECLDLLDNSDPQAVRVARSLDSLRPGLVEYGALRDANDAVAVGAGQNALQTGNNTSARTGSESIWMSLTSHISARTCTRILGERRSLSSVSSSPADTEHIPGLSHEESSSVLHDLDSPPLNFVPIDLKLTWPKGAVGPERTEKARDRSWYLGHIIDTLSGGAGREFGAKELLGEMQLCFVAVLTLANYSCLEQWKRILGVLLTCKRALGEVEEYFVEGLGVLRGELGVVGSVEGGLFEMDDEGGSAWLRGLLGGFRDGVDEVLAEADAKGKGNLQSVLAEMEKWLEEEYGWIRRRDLVRKGMVQMEDGEMVEVQTDDYDEEDERGEWAPVIVDT